ncbi:hypothetical protein CU098_000021, partial [Rhizopus stolonifer]
MTAAVKPITNISAVFNLLLTFLEKISDEDVWKSVLGERVVNLGQKYFGNDFVALSLAFYIAPILRMHWSQLMEKISKKVAPAGTISLKIYSTDTLYQCISQYVFDHGTARKDLQTGVAQYAEVSDRVATEVDDYDYDNDSQWCDHTNYSEFNDPDLAKVRLIPPSNFDEEIVYKGHLIKIEFKDASNIKGNEDSEHVLVSMSGRDTRKLHVILQEWSDDYNKNLASRHIYRSNGYSWMFERTLPFRDMDSIHLRDGQKDLLVRDMQTFKKRAEWYKKRGIPHRRGYLLYGPPGTGKTSTIQAIANELNLHIAIASCITDFNDSDLKSLIQCVPYNSIVVIEDIDHLFDSKEDDSRSNYHLLTMSGLLNIMDGMHSHEGSMIFMTCNNINKIQPALLRPGRIDLKLKFDYAAKEQIRDTYWRFMRLDEETSKPLIDEERVKAEKYADKFVGMIPTDYVTTAEIQSFFIDMLLEANYNNWTRDYIYEVMFERIPKFLKQVGSDREQAKKHDGIKDEEKSKETDSIESESEDEDQGKKKASKIEEV